MLKFSVMEVLSKTVTTEPRISYFFVLKFFFFFQSVCDDNSAITAPECLASVLDDQILKSDQVVILIYW